MSCVLKIGLVGPESTGKSTLAAALAEHYGTAWIPEYARAYVGALARPYTYQDVCHVAEQNRREANLSQPLSTSLNLSEPLSTFLNLSKQPSGPLFFDTELIITKVWLDEVYGRRPEWLTSPIPEDCRMDFYLLLSPDIAAVPDPLRENLSQPARERLFRLYQQEIESTGRPYAIIAGQGAERFQNALSVVGQFVKSAGAKEQD